MEREPNEVDDLIIGDLPAIECSAGHPRRD